MAPATCNQVAEYLLASFRDAGELLTHLKLQKLVYYGQAWYLANYNEPLVDECFQAWVHGPVCPSLYQRFKVYGSGLITEEVERPDLPKRVSDHLDEVMEAYGGFGAWELERMVHREDPWLEARAGLPLDANSNNVISTETMKRYYRARLEQDPSEASA